jgi:pilus assembly protein Flp/PilA
MISTFGFLSTWLQARLGESERGASLVEYALLVALIAVICVVAVTVLGESASQSFSSTASELN